MRFKPLKQLNAIVTQEYFEPTVSWAFRVVLALNTPLIVLSLFHGFSHNVIWAAFGAYLISLTDYRGLHYKKIVIQTLETVLVFAAAILGMYVSYSVLLSVLAMFVVGMFAAFIRNWSDYGTSIGIAVGFFFLFGLANPAPLEEALVSGMHLLLGAGWAIVITFFSFPFRPSNPVKRSVARIWKANTELLDSIIEEQNSTTAEVSKDIAAKEMAVRVAINQSVDLFARRSQKDSAVATQHYDILMELRRVSALFAAALSSMHEELEVIKTRPFEALHDAALYKTLSALAQSSARTSIVIYTSRPEDLTLAKVRIERCQIAVELFRESSAGLPLNTTESVALNHFTASLEKAYGYLKQSVVLLEQKLDLKKGEYFESYKLTFNNFLAGVNNWVITDFLRNLVNINSEQFRYALRVALGLCVGVFIFKFFRIDHGYWIPLTMIIVIQPYYGATRKKGVERIVGTVAGIVLGGLIMLLPLPYWAFVILLLVVSFFVAYFLRNNYKVGVFFVTIMMVILMQMSEQGSLELIGWRILSTLIGALLAFVAGYIFWPVWEIERFPVLIKNALLQTKAYLEQVIKYYNNDLPAAGTWYKNRRLAEEANTNAFACVQRMLEEPQNRQAKANLCFSLIGIIIRMTREITSIALVVDKNKNLVKIPALNEYAEQACRLLDLAVHKISEDNKEPSRPDFSKIKSSLNGIVFNESDNFRNKDLFVIKTELEKIIFELETIFKLDLKELR